MTSESDALAVVLIHGFVSSVKAWKDFERLAAEDPDLGSVTLLPFPYSSPKLRLNPLHRIPDLDDIADSLRGYLRVEAAGFRRLVLVAHSQGGLVVQRYLARTLGRGEGRDLARIRQIVLFACPNNGSELFLSLRRAWLPAHPQERGLRPLNSQVQDAQSRVINQIVHATTVAPHECPIPIAAYAGESDNIVTRASAQSVFKDAGVLPGSHGSIIRPDSPTHRSYTTFKQHVLTAAAAADRGPARPSAGAAGAAPLGRNAVRTGAGTTDPAVAEAERGPRPGPPVRPVIPHSLRRFAEESGWACEDGEPVELIDFRKNLASLVAVLDTVPPEERRVLGALLEHGTARASHKHWGDSTYEMRLSLLARVLDADPARMAEHLRVLQDHELVRCTAEGDEGPTHAETDGRRDSMDAYVLDLLRTFCHARGTGIEEMLTRLDFTALD